MKITELHVQGFRTLRDITWKPGNLNVIIGPNASGKSNLLKLLRLISMSAQGKLYDHVLKEGGIGAISWDSGGEDIVFSVVLEAAEDHASPILNYSAVLKQIGDSAAGAVKTETLDEVCRHLNGFVGKSKILSRTETDAWFLNSSRKNEEITQKLGAETLLSQMTGLTDRSPEIRLCQQALNPWGIYDELRTDSKSEVRRPTTARYDEHLESDGQNLTAVLHTLYAEDKEFKEDIDSTMSAAFGEEYSGLAFPPVGSQQVQLCVVWKSLKRPQPATSLSDGTLRFLQIITALAQPNPPALIAIDEPETGLHPSMMPLIAEYAEDVALRSQVILTTHSAEFLSDFNKEEPPTITVMELENAESRMRILDTEHLHYWLEHYSMGELYRTGELEQMDEIEVAAA